MASRTFQLSSQQRRAVEAPLGAVLVVAGPGAGKTACLIERIRWLVEKVGMAPERICAVTFTNKAAEEIALRLTTALGARQAEEVRRGTIHALCAEVLRAHPERIGLKAGFGIADEEYQRTVLRQMGQARRSGQLLQSFGRRRLAGGRLTPGDEKIFAEYQGVMRRRNMVDFDDLVVLTGRLFAECPTVADAVAARWSYVLVDEFQDVNAAQYAILKRLAEPHGNLFAVGDDEQSIYSWTGADPRILKRFEEDLGVRQIIPLDHNHRCSHQIFTVARRLLDENTPLFRKDLSADKISSYTVRAAAFADDDEEAAWILRDLEADRAAHDLDWGDFALLYRRHDIGDRLESRFIKAGVPCRLARGRPLCDDPVIGYVIAALRLLRDVTDGAAAEAFARKVLPEHVMQRVEAEVTEGGEPFLQALRDLAASLRGDPDAKKLWRLVYQVENLAAMRGRHQSLWGLVQELLSQRVGPYRNALEDRHEDIADPAADPAAAALADRLAAAQRDRARIVLERAGGLEIGLRGLLFGAGFRLVRYADEVEQAELDDVRVAPGDAGALGLALTLFKALQLLHARGIEGTLRQYVTFDLETTDLDTTTCEIVEIAAVRVVDGGPVDEFHRLVRPTRPVSPAAAKVHGHSDEALRDQPAFAQVWPELRAFLGDATVVAHNGLRFDIPVLRRLAEPLGGAERLRVFDTLPLARSLSGDSVKLTDLAARYGIDPGRAHHAIDDARTLAGVYEALERQRVVRARKSALVNLLSYLGLSLVLDGSRRDDDETKLLLGIARAHALGRFSDCLEFYEAERRRTGMPGPSIEEVVQRLGGRSLMDKLREEVAASRRYPAAVARLEALIDPGGREPLDAAIEHFLTRVALSTSQGAEAERHRVNLLTLHSTKGLEFSRVYVVGVEDEQLPGWIHPDENATHATEEARRLLYVGMTRARERLVLTRVDQRRGKPAGGSRFLEEMGLAVERPMLALLAPATDAGEG